MKEIILIPAVYKGSRDLQDRTKNLVFQTNEVTPKQAAELQVCVQEFVYLAIKREPFLSEQIDIISDLKADFNDTKKSPAWRLRAVLFRLWQQTGEGYEDFNLYYAHKMEQVINSFKSKLL